MDSWVKGNIFQLTLEQVGKRWGKVGLLSLGGRAKTYLPEMGYPAEDFYGLLKDIRDKLVDNDEYFFHMGMNSIKGDERWVIKFKDKDPNDLFNGFKYQGERYQLGDFEAKEITEKEIDLKMGLWTDDERGGALWAQYYLGRIQGALDLTGRKGNVDLQETNNVSEFTYNIRWE